MILGIIIAIGINILLIVGLIAAVVSEDTVELHEKTVLHIDIKGEIKEYVPENFFTELFVDEKPLTIRTVGNVLTKAKNDDSIEAVLLDIGLVECSWAKLQEIKSYIEEFKESKKTVYGYLSMGSEKEYYLLNTSDKAYIPPECYVFLDGFVMSRTYFKNTLDYIGIKTNVIRAGQFKSAGETFTKDKMSDEDRKQLNDYLDVIYNHFVNEIVKARNIKRDDLISYLNEGLFDAEELKRHRMIDDTIYYSDLIDIIKKEINETEELNTISLSDYYEVQYDENKSVSDKTIGLVYITGPIVDGEDEGGFNRMTFGDTTANLIRQARKDEEVSALIIRIDSPGGSGSASDIIWDEIRKTKAIKPVIASMSDIAASGGYYVAAPCTKIIAQDTTLTGSIGVFAMFINAAQLYSKLGITHDNVKRGSHADIGTTTREMTDIEHAKVSSFVERFYDNFLSKVANGRDMDKTDVEKIAGGRVWSGKDSLEIGLVDKLGSFYDAVDIAKEQIGIDKNTLVKLKIISEPQDFFGILFSGGASAGMKLTESNINDLAKLFNVDYLYDILRINYQHNILMMLPFQLSIN